MEISRSIVDTLNGSEGVEIIDFTFCKQPRSRKDVAVHFSTEFNNRMTPFIEESITQIWNKECLKNSRLYNGSKFRFSNASIIGHQLVLNIGVTCYRDLLGTNCDYSFGKELMKYGSENYQDSSACLADPLGVGALLLSKDNKFVMIERAMWTGEDKGKLDRPGGHPEPDNIKVDSEKYDGSDDSKNKLVLDEIFNSVLNEIRDEINLPTETLTDPQLMGIGRSLQRLGRPSAEFFVRCSLSSDEIENLYKQNTQSEADETVGILFIPEEDVRRKTLDQNMWSNLTDAACGAIELYSQCFN